MSRALSGGGPPAKFIQIAATQDTESRYQCLFALDADGDTWCMLDPYAIKPKWRRLPRRQPDALDSKTT